jgi:subtilisin family serine protease
VKGGDNTKKELSLVLIGILAVSIYVPVAASEGEVIRLIFETDNKDALGNVIEAAGGTVTIEFVTVPLIAAEVPLTTVDDVMSSPHVLDVYKDEIQCIPEIPEAEDDSVNFEPQEVLDLSECATEFTVEDMEDLPDTFYNYMVTGAEDAWYETQAGHGTVVAVIDTGVFPYHPLFLNPDGTSRIIGGISFIEDPDSWGDPDNHYHGTAVAGIIGGRGAIVLPKTDFLAQSIMMWAPDSYIDQGSNIIVPLLGMAPLTELYAIKVFPKDGSGVPSSVIMRGIDHAISMRLKYEETCGAEGVPIDVINLSLGGGTGYDGHDPEDLLVDAATKAGIVMVAAAGNSGPAFNTVETPGCANTSISVGATADGPHTRVGLDLIYGIPGIGGYFFPYDDIQVIYFSSRGATTDGRLAPDLVAPGVYILTTFPPYSIGTISGTSASCPVVSGAAALLAAWQKIDQGQTIPRCDKPIWPNPHCPDTIVFANPYQIRNAIIEGALPLDIPYHEYAQGNGFLNVPNSLDLLQNCIDGGLHLDSSHNFDVVNLKGGTQTWSTGDIGPGRTFDIIIAVDGDTEKIDISLTNVTIPGPQNPLLGDSIEFYVQSAVRTYEWYYTYSVNLNSNASFTIPKPDPGNMRITIEGDWTNWGTVSCDVTVTETEGREHCDAYHHGTIGNKEWFQYNVDIPAGLTSVVFELWWTHDWSMWPTYDLDMYIIDPYGYVYVNGALYWSPETVTIANPVPGTYIVLISGYEAYHGRDPFELRICYS